MVQAESVQRFNELLILAKTLLMAQAQQDGQVESNLAQFSSQRTTFDNYCLASLPGNCGRRGKVASEINHSSVLCDLNGGHTKTNTYSETPRVTCRDLLKRQNKHVLVTNEQLFSMHQQ